VVDAAIAPGRHELPRVEGVRYTGFIDPSGGSSDSMTLAIAHVEADASGARRMVLDLIREVRPPFSPDAVTAEFASLLKAYGPYRVRRSVRWRVAARALRCARRHLDGYRQDDERILY
jgi:hypothetical protein